MSSRPPGSATVFTTTFTSASPASSSSSTVAPSSPAQSPTTVATASSAPNAATIAGCVIGGVLFLVLVVLGILLYLRARKRKRTPPSSEFINSIRAGAAPVLRLDSGAEYTPALPEKGGGYTHYPPAAVPPPYHTSPPTLDMKFPDEVMMIDIPSGRPSVEKPLHPQRFSSQANDSFQHYPSSSVGSRRELWGSESASGELSPVHRSPRTDSALQFASHYSLDNPSHSPPPLHPLRRQPDPEDT